MGKFKDIWDRSKDGERHEQRSFLRFILVALTIFAIFLFVKKNNVVRWVQAGFTIRRQERTIERYKQDINDLDRQIDMLSNDRDTLEKFARETYDFAESGDDVYIEQK